MKKVRQGSILKIDGLNAQAAVISKDIYNESGQVVAVPIVKGTMPSPTAYIPGNTLPNKMILCDQIRHLDLRRRAFHQTGELSTSDLVEIHNIVTAIIDYF